MKNFTINAAERNAKKFFVPKFGLVAIAMTFFVCAGYSQIKVTSNGNLQIGLDNDTVANVITPVNTIGTGSSIAIPTEIQTGMPDSLSNLCILGKGPLNSGGYMTFGNAKNVWIGEMGDTNTDRMRLHANRGVAVTGGNDFTYMRIGMTSGTQYEFAQNGVIQCYADVYAPQYITTSDQRLKEDINPLADRTRDLMALEPVSYKLVSDEQGHTHFGLIAQDVRKQFPELVSEDADGNLGIDYTGLIPLLLQAYKESSAEIMALRAELAELKGNADGEADKLGASQDDSWFTVSTAGGVSKVTITGQSLCARGGSIVIEGIGSPINRVVSFPAYEGESTEIDCGRLNAGVYVFSVICADSRLAGKSVIVK